MKWTILVAVTVLYCLPQDASAGVIKQHPKSHHGHSAPLRNPHTHQHVRELARHVSRTQAPVLGGVSLLAMMRMRIDV